jgi:hypothetical protein
VDNPLSFGIVNQGISLSLLIMNVENKAVYTLYEFSRIDLIKSVPDYQTGGQGLNITPAEARSESNKKIRYAL